MNRQKGFTLIELMIVVVIVSIIAAVAYPSYINSIRKARRVDAKSALMEIAQDLEQYYGRNGTYTTDLSKLGFSNAGWNAVPVTAPASDQYYEVSLTTAGGCALPNCFIARARVKSGTDQANDSVSEYQLRSTGLKSKKEGGSWVNSWRD